MLFFCLVFVIAFVQVSIFVPCGHLLGKGWPLLPTGKGLASWLLFVGVSL